MSDPLDQLKSPFPGLVEAISPQGRKKIARDIAKNLRESQSKRIAAQQNPDGTPYAPRKSQARGKSGRIRRTMFAKMRTIKFLKAVSTSDTASVQFSGRTEEIARIHQFGLRDIVNKRRGLMVQYARRQLLGFSNKDKDSIADTVIDHLAK